MEAFIVAFCLLDFIGAAHGKGPLVRVTGCSLNFTCTSESKLLISFLLIGLFSLAPLGQFNYWSNRSGKLWPRSVAVT